MQKKSPLHITFNYMKKCNILQVYYNYNYPRSDHQNGPTKYCYLNFPYDLNYSFFFNYDSGVSQPKKQVSAQFEPDKFTK